MGAVEWPDMATLQRKEKRQTQKRRLRGKQQEPEERNHQQQEHGQTVQERNNPLTPVAIQLTEQVRTKLAYVAMARKHIEWTEEEKHWRLSITRRLT